MQAGPEAARLVFDWKYLGRGGTERILRTREGVVDFIMEWKLTGTQLKWLAIAMMAVDHVGAVVVYGLAFRRGVAYPGWEHVYWAMRTIGRLAFPIFCFLLSEGFCHTRSRKNYLLRLLAFAVVSEVPFDYALSGTIVDVDSQNVFFTLAIGLATIWVMECLKGKGPLQVMVVLAGCVLSELVMCDYGLIGIVLIVICHVFRQNKPWRLVAGTFWLFFGTALHAAVGLGPGMLMRADMGSLVSYLVDSAVIEVPGAFAFLLINRYHGEKGIPFPKYFFYAFYPLHLLLLGLLKHRLFWY